MAPGGPLLWLIEASLFLAFVFRYPTLGAAIIALYTATGGRWRKVRNALTTLPRDLHCTLVLGSSMIRAAYYEKTNYHILKIFQKHLRERPKQVALMSHTTRMTFEELEDFSNQVGRYFKEAGFKRGDVIGLLMDGRPEFVGIWLGLIKVGLTVALLNTTQRKKILQHSIDIVSAKAIIYGTELSEAVASLEEENLGTLKLYARGPGERVKDSVNLDEELPKMSTDNLNSDIEKMKFLDRILYIYTSGTTGLPKAAVITNARYILMAMGSAKGLGTSQKDTVYTMLPLYHSAGTIVGVGQMLSAGACVFIRPKFSASNFWKDCVKYKCTMAQYIGEICRFLLSTPECPEERQHCLRLMTGNGLRPQIWEQFVERFNIPQIAEFYGATEGNASMMNLWNKVGAVGYVPWYAGSAYPVHLLKVIPDTDTPMRGPDGLCIKAGVGEPGLLISKIKKTFPSQFQGYSDKEATKKKILHDVFEKGDSAFNSGDVLYRDELHYYYFRDRTGDTFRWKGENVSTSEVEAVISNIVGLKDAIVYGVEIPNNEGKAGMVAIVDPTSSIDFPALHEGMKNQLPAYARPLFVRLLKEAPMTGTHKLQKVGLQKDAYSLNVVKDPIYFLDAKKGFIPFTEEVYEMLKSGQIRV